jgi:predicted transcriptional regulator
MKNAVHNITRPNILEAIRYGQELFDSIAADTYSDNTPSDIVKLSRKQYYSKLTKLIKVGLIKRKSGRYLLTPFARVIYGVQLGFGDAVDNHLKTELQL